ALEDEPVECERAEIQEIRAVGNLGESRAARQFHRHHPSELRKVELKALYEPRQIRHDKNQLVFVASYKCQNLPILWVQKFDCAATECSIAPSRGDQSLHPPQERVGTRLLNVDVDLLIVILRIDNDRQIELLWIG